MNVHSETADLLAKANNYLKAGNFIESKKIFSFIAEKEENAEALHMLSRFAFNDREHAAATQFLDRAINISPEHAIFYYDYAIIKIETEDYESALEKLEAARKLDPLQPAILLYQGAVLEKLEKFHEAAICFRFCMLNALKDGKELPNLPPQLRDIAAHGRTRVKSEIRRLVENALRVIRKEFKGENILRVEKSIAYYLGDLKPSMPALQKPGGMFFPDLPDKKFFSRNYFPWLEIIESKTDVIRNEYLALQNDKDFFKPYVNIDADQGDISHWKEVNKSLSWNTCHLYRHGKLHEEVAARCPATLNAINSIPVMRISAHAPEVMFSVLKPKTKIPPHHGIINGRLIVHLPLIIPKNCGALRVAGETQTWDLGKCMIFDDSYAHEAWNQSDETRTVLIFDIWNPHLTDVERVAFAKVIETVDNFNVEALGRSIFIEN